MWEEMGVRKKTRACRESKGSARGSWKITSDGMDPDGVVRPDDNHVPRHRASSGLTTRTPPCLILPTSY